MSNNEEKFWMTDLSALFTQINFIPYGDVASGSRLNAMTRIIIVIFIAMLMCKYKYAKHFLGLSLLFILVVYICFKDSSSLHINTTLREPFIPENNVMTNQQTYNKEYNQYGKQTYNMFRQNYKNFPEPQPLKDTFDQNLLLPTTKRDPGAGIQYYSPDVGTNDRMFIEPLIAPRALDREVWSMPSTFPSGMNTETLYEATQSNNFPNNVNNYKQYEYGKFDYRRDTTPIYTNVGNWESDVQYTTEDPMITLQKNSEEKNKNIATNYAIPQQQMETLNNNLYGNGMINKSQGHPDLVGQQYTDENPNRILNQQVGGRKDVTSIENVLNKNPKTGNYMLEPTPTYIYTDDYFNQPQKSLYLQDVQPNIYSYAVEETPINSNIGITYTPQIPPKFRDEIYTDNKGFPVLTRIDPQLVRYEGLTPGQAAEQPQRNGLSSRWSNWNPPAGSINFEDIYDPRFTTYGDGTRAYSDINTGQVQYYYSDVDAYRQPNFIIRSNVDYINYKDPNGAEKPYYERTASLEDVKDIVENRFDADQLYFREDLMASLMEKRNSEMYQLRQAPLRKQNNSRFSTFGPGI